MKAVWKRCLFPGALALSSALFASGVRAADKQTLTGEVSDSMCGTQHMRDTPAECMRTCVGHGAKYTLVVGDKVYSLNTSDKVIMGILDQQAGKKAKVTGIVNGVGVDVSSVAPAR